MLAVDQHTTLLLAGADRAQHADHVGVGYPVGVQWFVDGGQLAAVEPVVVALVEIDHGMDTLRLQGRQVAAVRQGAAIQVGPHAIQTQLRINRGGPVGRTCLPGAEGGSRHVDVVAAQYIGSGQGDDTQQRQRQAGCEQQITRLHGGAPLPG